MPESSTANKFLTKRNTESGRLAIGGSRGKQKGWLEKKIGWGLDDVVNVELLRVLT